MTAAPIEWPSLDALLKTATPVEPVPPSDDFTVIHGWLVGRADGCTCAGGDEWPHEQHCGWEPLATIESLRLAHNGLAQARRIAVALEQENAHLTARATEAVALLSDALLWHSSETDNTAVAVQEALALLTGEATP